MAHGSEWRQPLEEKKPSGGGVVEYSDGEGRCSPGGSAPASVVEARESLRVGEARARTDASWRASTWERVFEPSTDLASFERPRGRKVRAGVQRAFTPVASHTGCAGACLRLALSRLLSRRTTGVRACA